MARNDNSITRNQRGPKQAKPNQLKEQKMKSHEFFKPMLVTAFAIVLAWLLSVQSAQAGGYTVTLQQVGPSAVAPGRDPMALTGLLFSGSPSLGPAMRRAVGPFENRMLPAFINTGPTSSSVDYYVGASGPGGFGTLVTTS